MKNQTARFVGGADSLVISLRRNREHLKTQVRHRSGETKAQVGCRNYFELTEEAEAQASFDTLVKDAISNGWTPQQKRARSSGFTLIPPAPSAPVKAERAGARR